MVAVEEVIVEKTLQVFEALRHPLRLKILQVLKGGKQNVLSLTFLLDCRQSAVSQHLRILYMAGLIKRERKGAAHYYSLTDLGKIALKVYQTVAKEVENTK